jgi:hypothetical protein
MRRRCRRSLLRAPGRRDMVSCAFSKHYPPENYVIWAISDSLKLMAGWVLRWLSAVRTRLRQRLDEGNTGLTASLNAMVRTLRRRILRHELAQCPHRRDMSNPCQVKYVVKAPQALRRIPAGHSDPLWNPVWYPCRKTNHKGSSDQEPKSVIAHNGDLYENPSDLVDCRCGDRHLSQSSRGSNTKLASDVIAARHRRSRAGRMGGTSRKAGGEPFESGFLGNPTGRPKSAVTGNRLS